MSHRIKLLELLAKIRSIAQDSSATPAERLHKIDTLALMALLDTVAKPKRSKRKGA